MVLP
ncbi:hypothetical protein E2C01_049319 [Portunus trituberculatus]|jgi:hypothetical protein